MKLEFCVQHENDGWNWCLRRDGESIKSFELNLENISEGALLVAAQQMALEEGFVSSTTELAAFRQLFANTNLMQEKDSLRPAWVRFDATETWTGALRAAAVFYQGLYLYLRDGERYKNFNADLALLLAAWQWYTAFSRLLPEHPETAELYTFGQAYQALASLLEDHHFDLAAQWMPYFGRSPDLPLVLAREGLRTGMVLSAANIPRSLHLPLAAPGAIKPIVWEHTRILPILFNNDGGKVMVRRLISDWLLARYDFRTSFHLARLLKQNKPQAHLWQAWFMLAWLVIWMVGMLAINLLKQSQLSVLGDYSVLVGAASAFILGPLVFILMACVWFEPVALVHLALPRLSGGIVLGYVAFILQKDAIDLALRFWEPGAVPLILLWFGVLLLGFVYLYFDALPRARTGRETKKRAILTLFAALVISMGMGLFMVALSSAAYGSCNLPCGCFVGPFGWVSWQQWLALVPLALFTGLITQFVLEERTVTAPVWSSD